MYQIDYIQSSVVAYIQLFPSSLLGRELLCICGNPQKVGIQSQSINPNLQRANGHRSLFSQQTEH